jgi:hypothetical protein
MSEFSVQRILRGSCRSTFISFVFLVALTASAQSQCPDVLGTPYTGANIEESLFEAEFGWLAGCGGGDEYSCQQTLIELDRADVAIDQMLIQCVDTYNNCRLDDLGNLLGFANRMAGLSDTLRTLTGWTLSHWNTAGKIWQWQQIRLCTTPPQPSCSILPDIENLIYGRMYQVWNYLYPPTGVGSCLTEQEAADAATTGDNVDGPGDVCTKCPPGRLRGTVNGVEVCYTCPAGTTLIDGCCQ